MKKYFLFISILIYFLPAIAGAGNSAAHKPVAASLSTSNLYTVLTATYPHTEFEIGDHTFSANSGCRQQSLQSFITAAESADRSFHNKALPNEEGVLHISSKQYLFYIYPSHNFW